MSVLEIESSQQSSIDLPIPAFPPFKLRSSMVDKDPVIWVHLIEVYIHYTQTLIQLEIPLTARSEQQLSLFVKTYLHEIAAEQGQLLSLGLINTQITENLEILRKWVFQLITQLGVLNLKLNGEALWDFAKIYGTKNSRVTRGLIDGSFKPKDKKSLNSISLVQKHIEHLIGNSKFDSLDLKILAILLNDKTEKSLKTTNSKEKVVRKNKSKDNTTPFGEKFITVSWIEMLEKFYAKGEGLFAKLSSRVALLSILNLNVHKVASLATELGATSMHSLTLYPLFAGIITSANFQNANPGLEKKLPFLIKRASKTEVSQDDVDILGKLFPDLSISHAEKLLRKHKDVEHLTNLLLENPELAIEKEEPTRYKGDSSIEVIEKKVISKHTNHVPDEHKNKTLTAALKLMYEADEDERDDTYDEAEAGATSTSSDTRQDAIEEFLWAFFKKDQTVFDRTQRKSRIRKEMKSQTQWSDEQIEGWARMLQKSPKRVKILEEKYLFKGNKPWKSSFANKSGAPAATTTERTEETEQKEAESERKPRPKQDTPGDKNKTKIQQSRNERNKSSRANHNRKAGHDKKLSRGFN